MSDVTQFEAQLSELKQHFSDQIEALGSKNQELSDQYQELTTKYADLLARAEASDSRAEAAEAQVANALSRAEAAEQLLSDRLEQEKSARLEERAAAVEALNLDADQKQKYSEWAKNPDTNEAQFETTFSLLQRLSDSVAAEYKKQNGDASSRQAQADNPYKDMIERNHKLAEKRLASVKLV